MVSNVTAAESETTLGMSSDATPLSRAALQRHEEAVFEIASDGVFTPQNPLAAQLDKRLAPYDRTKIAAMAKTAVDQERAIVDLVDVGEGQYIQHLQMTLVPVSGRHSAFCFVRDLTLDYSLRRTLVDSRRRYRDFVEISSDFTWETGGDSKFAYVTPHGALGYTADNLLALHPDDLVASESRGDNPFLTRDRLEHHEVWLQHRDGQVACMVVSALPLIDAEGVWRGARGVCRDVSELREREAALVRVNNRERVLTRIVRAFRDEVNPEAMLAVAAEVLAKGLGADFSQVFRSSIQPVASLEAKNEYVLAAKYGDVVPPDASDILTLFSGGAGCG